MTTQLLKSNPHKKLFIPPLNQNSFSSAACVNSSIFYPIHLFSVASTSQFIAQRKRVRYLTFALPFGYHHNSQTFGLLLPGMFTVGELSPPTESSHVFCRAALNYFTHHSHTTQGGVSVTLCCLSSINSPLPYKWSLFFLASTLRTCCFFNVQLKKHLLLLT